MTQANEITQAGLEKLKTELNERIAKREELKTMIEEMRNRGDLSENDGYTLALEDNESNERRIAELEELVTNAVVVNDIGMHVVSIGNSVEVDDEGKSTVFEIVGESETDPMSGKISSSSPIGSALMGKKVGDTAKVQLPKGETEFKILKIS